MNLDPDVRKTLVLNGAGNTVFSRGLLADLMARCAPDTPTLLGPVL